MTYKALSRYRFAAVKPAALTMSVIVTVIFPSWLQVSDTRSRTFEWTITPEVVTIALAVIASLFGATVALFPERAPPPTRCVSRTHSDSESVKEATVAGSDVVTAGAAVVTTGAAVVTGGAAVVAVAEAVITGVCEAIMTGGAIFIVTAAVELMVVPAAVCSTHN